MSKVNVALGDGSFLLRDKPYKVRPSGIRGMVVALNPLTQCKQGERLYQVLLPNGDVLLCKRRPVPKSVTKVVTGEGTKV
jgi:hypothetical protein